MFVILMFIKLLCKNIEEKKRSENDKQKAMNIPEWLFKKEDAPIKNKIKKYTILKH